MNCEWPSTIATSCLAAAGYHSQVLVPPFSSLLFLFDSGIGARVPLRRTAEDGWHAARQSYSTAELLAILDAEPERLSPNALLRPVFQDSILPTAAYVGGPSEVAYFAQSQVLYERILGRTTPVLPRLSATLVEPAVADLLARYDVSLPDVIQSALKDPLESGSATGCAIDFRDRQAQARRCRKCSRYGTLGAGHVYAFP